jgi:hypothetical protein
MMTLASTVAQRSGIAKAQADEVLRLLELFGLVDKMTLARAERDAKIYELRAIMTTGALADRFGMTERRIQQVVRVQLRMRRAG